jgi:thiol-disulfide isomerase/thioredoxin
MVQQFVSCRHTRIEWRPEILMTFAPPVSPSAKSGAFLVFVLFVCAMGFAQAPSKPPASHPPQGKSPSPAKPLDLIDLAGYRKLLADHRGKPLLITFWATWCEPCREEFPLVNQLAKQYASQGLVVLGVDMDDDAELTLVRHFIERNQPVFPSVRKRMGHEDEFVDGVDPTWKGVMPVNFFYAADGRLMGFMVGAHPREDFEKAIRATFAASSSNQHRP